MCILIIFVLYLRSTSYASFGFVHRYDLDLCIPQQMLSNIDAKYKVGNKMGTGGDGIKGDKGFPILRLWDFNCVEL